MYCTICFSNITTTFDCESIYLVLQYEVFYNIIELLILTKLKQLLQIAPNILMYMIRVETIIHIHISKDQCGREKDDVSSSSQLADDVIQHHLSCYFDIYWL